MPSHGQKIQAITFGKKGCDDIRIAAKAAKIKGAIHSIYELDNSRWLNANLSAVWCTDGEMCFLDTYGNEFLSSFSEKMSICLNGIAGDAIHGGSSLGMKGQHFPDMQDPYGHRAGDISGRDFDWTVRFFMSGCRFTITRSLDFPCLCRTACALNRIFTIKYCAQLSGIFPRYPVAKIRRADFLSGLCPKIISLGKRASSRMLRTRKAGGCPLMTAAILQASVKK